MSSTIDIESERLKELASFEILDTPAEKEFDDLTKLASEICGTPISVVSLVDDKRQWFKSKVGITENQTSREIAFCSHAILESNVFIVSDASQDSRFETNPLVISDPKIRFYAGAQLITPSGNAMGTICVIDKVPRYLTAGQLDSLKALARQTTSLLLLRKRNIELKAALQESEGSSNRLKIITARLEALVENLQSGVLAVDSNGVIITANKAFLRMFNLDFHPCAAEGAELSNLITVMGRKSESEELFLKNTNSAIELKEAIFAEELSFSGGLSVERDFVPIYELGRYQGHLWTYLDVSKKKLKDQIIENQRSQILESAKLTALGEMAGGISHELNNPLAIIQGRVEYIKGLADQNNLSSAVAIEYCGKISSTVNRMVRIINGLRTIARDGDRDEPQEESMIQIVTNTLEFCQTKFKFHGVTLKVNDLSHGALVPCRSVQISQVILNLLNNSFDAVVGSKNPWIEINLSLLDGWLEIQVLDSGAEIPSSIINQLFNSFFTTKPPGKGTGIGLSISKGLIEEHGGKLSYSRQKDSTCFSILLPNAKQLDTNPKDK